MAKEKTEDGDFRTVQNILRLLAEIWNDLSFEDIQTVFRRWQILLNRAMENGREHCFE
jgi:hypothetical protein